MLTLMNNGVYNGLMKEEGEVLEEHRMRLNLFLLKILEVLKMK
jgi:hypothetical protein|tara:strand:- start:566 stop:694 length:129 start_codon:yes stop_codon:yes gene_type:complete